MSFSTRPMSKGFYFREQGLSGQFSLDGKTFYPSLVDFPPFLFTSDLVEEKAIIGRKEFNPVIHGIYHNIQKVLSKLEQRNSRLEFLLRIGAKLVCIKSSIEDWMTEQEIQDPYLTTQIIVYACLEDIIKPISFYIENPELLQNFIVARKHSDYRKDIKDRVIRLQEVLLGTVS